jgi:cytosine deaminase
MDLLIKNARLLDHEGTWSIGVADEKIVSIDRGEPGRADVEFDAEQRLVAPTYVNAHVHLDKSNLGDVMRPNRNHSFQESLEITWEHKRKYTVDDIVDRASRAIQEGIARGTTVFRVFADVDSIGGLRPIEGIFALREKWAGIVDIEVVDFPQEALIRDPESKELMEEAMKMGADIVGGLPWHEYLDQDARDHIDFCFELAKKFDTDIHMLVDDTDNPNSRSLEYLAVKTMREGFEGRVIASHCGALAAYDEVHAQKVISMVEQSNISICSNPQISLVVGGRYDEEPIRRAITRVKQLWAAGVNILSAQDDVNDPYYPFGRNDQQEVALIMCHAAHMTYPHEVEAVFDFVTRNAARAMRLDGYGIEVGNSANFNVLSRGTIQHTLRMQQPPALVVRRGQVLSRSSEPELSLERATPLTN